MDDAVKDISANFGLVVAFLLPGFVGLWGFSLHYGPLQNLFEVAEESETSIGAFLFVVLASLAMGVFVSGLRWSILDCINEHSGLPKPNLDYKKLIEKEGALKAYDFFNENCYRYYQFYGNMAVAFLGAYIAWTLCPNGRGPCGAPVPFVVALLVESVLVASARDSLRKHDANVTKLLA
jgi:hypothetical protein